MYKSFKITTPLLFLILGFILAGGSVLASSGVFISARVSIERIQITSGDIGLSALLFTPAEIEEPGHRPAILAFHGWAGTKENLIPTCLGFAEAGYVVLAMDLRGHGESQGIADLGGLDQQDGRVAIDYLVSRTDIVNSSALATWGSSFGGVISLLVAGTDPRISTAIASSTPSNISAWLLERDFRWQERVNFRPHVIIDPGNKTELDIRNPITHLDNISSLLILHGENDAIVPVQQARDLHTAAPTRNKKLVVFPNQGHNLDASLVKQETIEFLNTAFNNPNTVILGSTLSYYLIIFSWVLLLAGGLLITFAILSLFPYIEKFTSIREISQEEKPDLHGTTNLLIRILTVYVIGRAGSVILSLLLPTYYSTLFAITFAVLVTGAIIIIGFTLIFTPSPLLKRFQRRAYLEKVGIEVGIAVAIIFFLYMGFVILLDHPWIPFINLQTALNLWSVFLTIGLVLAIDAIFFWEIMYQNIRGLQPSCTGLRLYILLGLVYFFTKLLIFFGLIFLLYSTALEITLILYGIIIFGLLAAISPLVRIRWGLSAAVVSNVIAGFVAYSTFSIFFLVI